MLNIFRRYNVGLVLGGGGVRGFFHLGVIKALQELNIEVDEIAGTSIGAVVGAMYAENPKLDVNKITKEVNFKEIVKTMFWESRRKNTEEVKKFLKKFITAEKFEDLKIRLKFNAADINNKEEVVFDKGDLFPGLVASISVPGIFQPVNFEDRYLLDGGLINNVPTTLISEASNLIVSDITSPVKKIGRKSSPVDVLYSSVALMQQEICVEKIKHIKDKQIVYLNLKDETTSILDFRSQNFQRLIDEGYDTMMVNKEKIADWI